MIVKISGSLLSEAEAVTRVAVQNIQGFYAKPRHYIRDLSRAPGSQVIWDADDASSTDYDDNHAAMCAEITRIKYQIMCDWLAEHSPATARDI